VSWAADVGSSIRRGRLRDASETASGWLLILTRRGRNNERMRIKVVGTIVVPSSESGFMERTDPPTDGAERPKGHSYPEHVLRPEHHRTGWYRYRSEAARSW
jgi:hypothetical protein